MIKLVFVMDLGTFKAFRLDSNPSFSTPRLVTLDERKSQVEERISDMVTDQAGQFAKGSRSFAAVNDMANGENHNLALENRRRAMKEFAEFAADAQARYPSDGCYLAAPEEISEQVLSALKPQVRNSVEKVLRCNLTKVNNGQVVEHFCGHKS